MDRKIALIGILIYDQSRVEQVNQLLHAFSQYIVGRMGVPYREKSVCVISLTLDAPENIISTLSGKLGQLDGIQVKSMIAKQKTKYTDGSIT